MIEDKGGYLIYFSLQSPQYLIEETCTHSFIKQKPKSKPGSMVLF
jgi:hypothetical protein